jgi:hypothetical protein
LASAKDAMGACKKQKLTNFPAEKSAHHVRVFAVSRVLRLDMKISTMCFCAALLFYPCALAQPANTNAAAKATTKYAEKFEFKGGNLKNFLDAIKNTFGVDISELGTVPESMLYSVRVPKMRVGSDGGRLVFQNVLNLYNQVSAEGDPSMGTWIIKGPFNKEPEVLLLVSRATGEATLAVKAFAIPDKESGGQEFFNRLHDTISVEANRVWETITSERLRGFTVNDVRGSLNYHPDSGILVVTGGKLYVELAGVIIDALKEKRKTQDITIPALDSTSPKPK